MDEEDKSFRFIVTPITAVKATHQKPLLRKKVCLLFSYVIIQKTEQSLNLPSREGRDGSDEMVSLSMVVTEMYQIVAGGQEANQGQLWSKGINCKLQSCNLVMTKPSTVGTVEEESVTAKRLAWRQNEIDEKRGTTQEKLRRCWRVMKIEATALISEESQNIAEFVSGLHINFNF
ncbi:hypothetical protein HID58_028884 [Brassica napus]|uniref:Uncharacterized protein n=1 Tax=Brassica napus TaxID=3708 RepID=A0ABQ8CD18_BRANA|nr:hypothetical protein HID58_028884 [Brassica napus]